MTPQARKKLIYIAIAAVLLILIDQVSKYLVRIYIGPSGPNVEVFSWFKLCFVENPGAAFGMQLGPKILLTLFRVVAVSCLSYAIYCIIKRNFSTMFVVALMLVTAGAAGNIIDCVFYAKVFDGGDWLVGKVVDMLYFPIVKSTFPEWFPFWGGESFVFFRPVFNFADSCICVGVFYLIIFKFRELGAFMDLCSDKLERCFSKKKNETNSESDSKDEN